jgi:hypothetical protein
MSKFRKKPIVVEAIQLKSYTELKIIEWAHAGMHPAQNSIVLKDEFGLQIRTLDGWMHASFGDWIIKGVNGEFCPCKPDIFEKTYERVED